MDIVHQERGAIPPYEYRFTELRREGERSVSGTVIRYGDVADIEGLFDERIERNAFKADDAILNLFHDRRRPLARQGQYMRFDETGDALRIRAELVNTPSGDEALALIEAGVIRGMSVEMRVSDDRWETKGDKQLRTIIGATLHGVALVDRPAYPQSSVDRWTRIVNYNPDGLQCTRRYLYV